MTSRPCFVLGSVIYIGGLEDFAGQMIAFDFSIAAWAD
jgi:hypothetical protein